jgi:hypothetical protein
MKIVQATGQTCNQFWIYSNFLADAIEKKEKFAIWVPDISFEFFPSLLNSEYISYPLYSKRLTHLIGHKKYIKILNYCFSNKFSLKFFQLLINILSGQSFIIADVGIKKSEYKYKNLAQLIQLYIPSEPIVKKVDLFIENIRNEFELIVGLHIRLGDYRTFQNGKYFYDLKDYVNFIKNCEELFKEKKTAFFITSNEKIDMTFFTDYDCFYFPNASMAEDLYCLGKTDYILGPPSTFSAWASLYKNTPLYFIETPKIDFKKTDFIDIKSVWF